MRFLVDNALSPAVSKNLKKAGYDSIHVREIGLRDAEDEAIFQKALREERTIISADTDFGYLLVKWNKKRPSVIIFRKGSERNPVKQTELLKVNLPELKDVIEAGSIIVFESQRIRTRELPILK